MISKDDERRLGVIHVILALITLSIFVALVLLIPGVSLWKSIAQFILGIGFGWFAGVSLSSFKKARQ